MKKRASNYELLRIIAIVFITFNHINTYCDVHALSIAHPFNLFLSFLFGAGGKFGCNVFLLISAYFLANKESRTSTLFRIFLQTFFYLMALDIVYLLLIREGFTLRSFAVQILRTLNGKNYWYAFAYFVLLLVVPILKSWMRKIKHPKTFLCTVGLLFCVLPTVTMDYLLIPGFAGQFFNRLFDIVMYGNVLWFWYVFCVVFYLRRNPLHFQIPALLSAAVFGLSYLAMALISYRIYLAGCGSESRFIEIFLSNYSWVRNSYSLLCILSAAGLFLWLHRFNLGFKPWINRLGGYTFGIYLLQTHPLMRSVLYNRIFDFQSIYESRSPILYLLFGGMLVLLLVVIGCMIEFFRAFLEKWIFERKGMERIIDSVSALLEKAYRIVDKNLL